MKYQVVSKGLMTKTCGPLSYAEVDHGTEARLRINENGRVVIPVSSRKALGINPGDEVRLRLGDDERRFSTLRSRLEQARCHVRKYVKPGVSLVDEWIAERREAGKRE